MVILQSVLVFDYLSVQFVYQFIHCGIHVFMRAFSKHVAALHVDIAFSFLTTLFFGLVLNAQEHLHVHHLIEMSGYAV